MKKITMWLAVWATLLVVTEAALSQTSPQAQPARITVLYDAFGRAANLQKDWGYSALIEVGGRRILFDTGDNPDILGANVKALGVDLSRLDFVVLSHRHSDHMGGMEYLLSVNPKVKIYAPKETFGIYGSSLPSKFYRKHETLQPTMRYYDGRPPETMVFGSAWPHANIELIDQTAEIAPGLHLIALVSDKPGTLELKELSLAIRTPDGIVLVVGCSHPGLDRIVAAAQTIDLHIHLIAGGFHMVVAPDAAISEAVALLHDSVKVDYIAPGHCTGEPTFAALLQSFGDRYLYAGLGTVIALGPQPRLVSNSSAADAALDQNDRLEYARLMAQQDDARSSLAPLLAREP
jgi:7,8-dihydropterin-6-yl-methyl-4-(beta-D-ribofuranosyl)aminobenzene 5'-phosphate synthase